MDRERQGLFNAMAVALHYLRPPTQHLQFLAKVLITGELRSGTVGQFAGVEGSRFLLGTPLYVSQASQIPDESTWGLDDQW